MPRNFDSSEESTGSLGFVEIVECPVCSIEFEGEFTVPEDQVEDLVAAPLAEHLCPGCGARFETQLSGWHMHQEAG